MKDSKLEAWEQKRTELTEEYNKLKLRLSELEIELPPIQKQLTKQTMKVIQLKELAKITGEKNPEDLKLANKRLETLQNKHQSTNNQIDDIKARIKEIERIKHSIMGFEQIRKWILAKSTLWQLRKKALDTPLTEAEADEMAEARRIIKRSRIKNEIRITTSIDRGTYSESV